MWKWMFFALLLCPVAAIAQRSDGQRLANDAEQSIVLKASREVVKDPDSVKVSSLVVMQSPSGNGLIFCGLLNAKNSYGGYTGNQIFGGTMSVDEKGNPSSAHVAGMDDAGEYAGSLACKALGFP